ncbi:hypothetical protein llap_3207 [Limosa lapponica baueri]|uniref:Uncharacterized protein n=1 Tax=Limosa lapponica baueri TaxID=1758121 RepID=A0A2I0UKF3_LIMLA|nr:hypothetical protein llap_3207 [Limosa lapponica baueri]
MLAGSKTDLLLANQQRWYHLCDNIFEKGGKKTLRNGSWEREEWEYVRKTTLQTPRCLEMRSRMSCTITFPGMKVRLTGL